MTAREEQELLRTLRSLKKELGELRDMLKPYTPKQDEFLNTSQTIAMIGVSRRKLASMLADGELPFATKVGRTWRFSKNGIMSYLGKTG